MVEKADLTIIPFKNDNYLYDYKTKTVWSRQKNKRTLRQKKMFNNVYRLNYGVNKKYYEYSPRAIEDLIAHPEIKGDDIITIHQLRNNLHMTRGIWDMRHCSALIGAKHTRYTSKGKKVRGWTKSEIDKAIKQYPKTFNH